MKKKINKDLFSQQLFEAWTEKDVLLPIESYFIEKYLIDTKGKVIEAGTGGGRIIFEIEKLGFSKLEAFDYVENMIALCNKRKKELNSAINFKSADATNLIIYDDNKFDYLIYLQQVLCFVDRDMIHKALNEAHRIGKENSTYIFSFLNWNAKFYNPVLSLSVNFFRFLRNEKPNKYELPWLNIGGKFNWKFLNKNQPRNMWFKEIEIVRILEKNGFSILEVKKQIKPSDKCQHIHLACKKSKSNYILSQSV